MQTLENLLGQKHLSTIRDSGHGNGKLEYLSNNISLLEALVDMDFNGYHISTIMHGSDWQEKLDWVRDNYQDVLEPMGFNGSHVSQIVRNEGWQEKLDWVRDNYQDVLEPMGFEPTHAARILKNKAWQEKIDWLANNYENSIYTQAETAKIMTSKNWLQRMNYSLSPNISAN